MPRKSNYDKYPFIPSGSGEDCAVNFDAISSQLARHRLICVECYPGVFVEELERELAKRLNVAVGISCPGLLQIPPQFAPCCISI